MMTLILIFLILLSPSIFYIIKHNKTFEKILPLTIFSIILIIYVFGLLNLLKLGFYIVIMLSLIYYILSIKELYKQKNFKNLLKKLFTPGFVIWCIFYFLLFLFYKNRMLANWDEFTHWGDVVKMMYNNNVFSTNPISLSAAKTYPPNMAIWQYFFQVMKNSNFSEYYLFISYQLFALSLFLPFLKNVKWKDYYKILIIILVIILSPILIFKNYYATIYIDAVLGMMFAHTLALIFTNKEYDKFSIIQIGLSLFTLTLLKDVAPLFSLICWGAIVVDIIFVKRNYKYIKKTHFKIFLKKIYPIFVFLFIIFGAYFSWKLNIVFSSEVGKSGNVSNIQTIIKNILSNDDSYMKSVVLNYINALSNYKIFIGFNVYVFSIIMILFCYLIHQQEKNKYKSRITILILFAGELLYIFIMLLLYLMKFSEYEATILASYDRYIGIYLNAILFFVIFLIINNKNNEKIGKNLLILISFIIINIPINNFLSMICYNRNDIQNTINNRQEYIRSYNMIKNKIGENKKSKIYIIVQNSDGLDKWILKYSIRDILSGVNDSDYWSWSLGEKYSDGDLWTKNIDSNEWMDELIKNYDYVFLFRVDEPFIKKYGNLFDNNKNIRDNELYKVNINTRKLILCE